MIAPTSERVRFLRLSEPLLEPLHRLACDPHVRRYLLDGEVVPRAWCDEVLAASDVLFARRGVGLWLLEREQVPIGFAGFHVFPDMGSHPQLLYALVAAQSGQGLATEVARGLVDFAARQGLERVEAAVDAPNQASIRVLGKLGFERLPRVVPGAFGDTLLFRLELRPRG